MSSTPHDFFLCAKSQLTNNDEISFRSCISRAYYAAYHLAQEKWQLNANSNNGVGMHKAYISQLLQAAPNTNERRVGVKLQTMHTRRVKADYKLTLNVESVEAVQQISATHEVFTIIAAIP